MMGAVANDALRNYLFAVVPLFVLMGLLVTVSGVGKDTFDVFERLLRRVPAGSASPRSSPTRLRGDHRHLHRLGHRLRPRRRARDDAARLHQALRDRRRRGELGARHADPAVAPDDRLRGAGRGQSVGRMFLAGVGPGHPARACLLGHDPAARLAQPGLGLRDDGGQPSESTIRRSRPDQGRADRQR
jgi:C4-dicarboxylate transporter, DctM subunit